MTLGGQRKTDREEDMMLNWHFWKTCAPNWTFAGGIYIPCFISFFPPFIPFCHSCYVPTLSFAPGTALCCPTSALITAPGRPPSTSRLACESTRPRAVITQKSSKSGHVKLREVFREPTQVSEGVSWKFSLRPDLHVKKSPRWFRVHHKVVLKLGLSHSL